jgi:hypothetical protein
MKLFFTTILIAVMTLQALFQIISYPLRNEVRWMFHRNQYENQVLSMPHGFHGELQYITWDSWDLPFSGVTTIYLVYDPTDNLSQAYPSPAIGKPPGLPCRVEKIKQLENHWYTVRFFRNQEWENCNT